MDSPAESQGTPIYETLTFSSTSQSQPPGSPEPYSVFRSEISLAPLVSTDTFKESAAPDFLSLDFDAVSDGEPSAAEPVTPLAAYRGEDENGSVTVSEKRMESQWLRGNSKFKSPMLQLHKEIVDFCDFLSPTAEEKVARNAAIESVSNVIKYIWPTCKVEVFGSFRTGLYLPTSDIDVVILDSGIKNPQPGLYALSRALSQKGIAKKIQVIAKARVPIVKFVEKKSEISFDISFDVDNGPKAATFIKEAVSKWPPLRPLCLILKVFLHQRELNEVYSGGVGSYALLTMLMALLQYLRDHQAICEDNLGVLLIHFFDFYGRKLNTNDVGISCNGAGTFFSKRSKGFMNQGKPFLISIQDPQAPDNDIGKNSYNYFQVKSAFAMAYITLTNPKTILGLGPSRSILGTIIRPDPLLLERKGGYNGDMTFNALLPGAGEPLESHFNNELVGNWQFDDEEEALPRGGGTFGNNNSAKSSKKRKSAAKEGSSNKKAKENGKVEEKSSKKKKRRAKKKKQLFADL